MLLEASARWLGEFAVMESKLALVSRPGKFARGTSEVARRPCDARNNLAQISRPGKVARGTSEVARRTCGAGK
ncbi:hypothetical protein CRG98_032337 [Punica granatum]|uniref:Uncharacterized protein n=1 Tax=Punica granatum TaxID=22663 RepID=A0A2I0ITD6_PUNGR|nr:hypothetical protein CRG98_032337 [Punica granatum]